MRKAWASYERVRVRVIPGVPPTFCKTFANLGGIYYTAHVEKKSRGYALPLRNSKCGVKVGDTVSEALRTMEESKAARAVCVRPCHLFSGASSHIAYSLPLFFSLRHFVRYPGRPRPYHQ